MIPERLTARLALGVKDEARAQVYARKLNELGFEVASCGPRGVNFSGPATLFAKAFGELTESPTGIRFAKEPRLPADFGADVDSIYFPTKPIFL